MATSSCSLDPQCHLVSGQAYGTGYHTRLAPGTPVHPLRESIGHAVQLLEQGDSATAARVVEAVLAHQVTDPFLPAYGIWPWFAEEPVAAMAPPDWNWADFIGAQLCEILVRLPGRLPAATEARVREALGHAAWSIFRRNVQPGYTNICLMGAAVSAVAGEVLAEPRLLAYARRRLEVFLAHTEDHGSFNEYNSPTYTIIAIEEVERAMRLVQDAAVRATAGRLLRIAWGIVAEHWHPGTGEWAGPCSRAYHDRVQPGTAATLALKTGMVDARGGQPAGWAVLGPPCPPDLAARFAALPEAAPLIRRRFARGATPELDIVGTTWMDARACLGTVNRGTTWTQCRAVLGYWRIPGAPAAMLRVRLLKDGRDFASGVLWSAQDGAAALVSLGFATDQGDWHCHLDRPADGTFPCADLRLRVELQGQGATAVRHGAGWRLAAGDGAAVVLPAACRCADAPLAWTPVQEDGRAAVDLALPHGAGRFAPSAVGGLVAACAIALDGGDDAVPTAAIVDGRVRLAWRGLAVEHRATAGPAFG